MKLIIDIKQCSVGKYNTAAGVTLCGSRSWAWDRKTTFLVPLDIFTAYVKTSQKLGQVYLLAQCREKSISKI